jgi:uncharacterized protein
LPIQADSNKTTLLRINKQTTYQVELAISPKERQIGLMHRKRLPIDRGMLFIYRKPSKVRIWMKNTVIPLDIVWLSDKKIIQHIERNTTPYSKEILVNPSGLSKYILELNAGQTKLNRIQKGDSVEFSINKNPKIIKMDLIK